MRDRNLVALCHALGAEYIRVDPFSGRSRVFNKRLWKFRIEALKRIWKSTSLSKKIRKIVDSGASSADIVRGIYDVEYSDPQRPNYAYLSSMLFAENFEKITGISRTSVVHKKIHDVGAGSNELLRFLCGTMNILPENLTGSDVSAASVALVERDGFRGYQGRLESIKFPKDAFDLLSLSYFIDQDTDQKGTFEEAVRVTRPGGLIILEGKFPSRPFELVGRDKSKIRYVTKGKSIVEDITSVCEAFLEAGHKHGKNVRIQRIVQSRRYVYSRYGFRKLPSYFLVIHVADF